LLKFVEEPRKRRAVLESATAAAETWTTSVAQRETKGIQS